MDELKPWYKYYPENALEYIDVKGRKLQDLLYKAEKQHPEKVAIICQDKEWSYSTLNFESQKIVYELHNSGIKSGDRVAIHLNNCPEYLSAMFGTWISGGTVVHVNSAYVPNEVARIIKHAEPRVFITTSALLETLNKAGIFLDIDIYLVDDKEFCIKKSTNIFQCSPEAQSYQSEQIAVLQYTGGTTGEPKAVMLSHENLLSNIEQRLRVTLRCLDVPSDATIVNTLPICHIYGLTSVTLSSIASGLTQLLVPRFEVNTVLELIKKYKPFAFYGVPTMYAAFLKQPNLETFNLEYIKSFTSAGAPMPEAQKAQFEARVNGRIFDGFGISEASPSVFINPMFYPKRIGSSGIPVPFTEARIVKNVDGVLEDVPHGESGELIIKGPQVMMGYWKDKELTEKTILDGWLLTGDTAILDKEGFVYIVGRIKDVIVASGYNIYPAEIEQIIVKFEDISEASVIGVPDPYRGETVKAIFVAHHERKVNIEALKSYCKQHLAPFKVPTLFEQIDELPRTAVGKVDKKKLTSLYA